MNIERGLQRVVVTLDDSSRMILGSECSGVHADAEFGVVNLSVGSNGSTAVESYDGVQHVLVEGVADRVLIETTLRGIGLEYPRRLVVVDFSLTEGRLGLTTDGKHTIAQGVTVLGVNRV